jgi:hypothetical protein
MIIPTDAQPFTCHFPGGHIAVVFVVGAANDEQALAEVSQAFTHCRYTVTKGDPTGGKAEPFYLWVCRQPQREQTSAFRNMPTLRNETTIQDQRRTPGEGAQAWQ